MVLKKTRSGRCEATPTLFRPFSPKNSKNVGLHRLGRCALFFRRGGGSHQIQFSLFALSEIQKEFLFENIFWYTGYAHNIISKSAEMVMLERF